MDASWTIDIPRKTFFGFTQKYLELNQTQIANILGKDKKVLSTPGFSPAIISALYRDLFDPSNNDSVFTKRSEDEDRLRAALKSYLIRSHPELSSCLETISAEDYKSFIEDVLKHIHTPVKPRTGKKPDAPPSMSDFKSCVAKAFLGYNQTDPRIVFYAWVCVARTLPILFYTGSLNDYWMESIQQKNLYKFFYGLDAAAKNVYNYDAHHTQEAANNAIDVLYQSTNFNHPYRFVIEGLISPDRGLERDLAAAIFFADVARLVFGKIGVDIEDVLLKDIALIKTGNFHGNTMSTKDLCDRVDLSLWGNFQGGLEKLGCGYWFRLYDGILAFKKGIDRKELEARHAVNISDAARVGQHMESLGY